MKIMPAPRAAFMPRPLSQLHHYTLSARWDDPARNTSFITLPCRPQASPAR